MSHQNELPPHGSSRLTLPRTCRSAHRSVPRHYCPSLQVCGQFGWPEQSLQHHLLLRCENVPDGTFCVPYQPTSVLSGAIPTPKPSPTAIALNVPDGTIGYAPQPARVPSRLIPALVLNPAATAIKSPAGMLISPLALSPHPTTASACAAWVIMKGLMSKQPIDRTFPDKHTKSALIDGSSRLLRRSDARS